MSELEIKNLSPAPYFARFLEGQDTRTMTNEEMATVQGGQHATPAAPAVCDFGYNACHPAPSLGQLKEDIHRKLQEALGGAMPAPTCQIPMLPEAKMVTQAYPSDSDIVGS